MRILLDECMPAGLARDFVGHEAVTVPQMGWAGLKNGELLGRMVEAKFDLFVTVDKNLPGQQKLANYAIAVVVLRCPTNDIRDLRKLVPEFLIKLSAAQKSQVLTIG